MAPIRIKFDTYNGTNESPERQVSTPPALSSTTEMNFTLPQDQQRIVPEPVRRGRGRPSGRVRIGRSSPRRGRTRYSEPYADNRRPRR